MYNQYLILRYYTALRLAISLRPCAPFLQSWIGPTYYGRIIYCYQYVYIGIGSALMSSVSCPTKTKFWTYFSCVRIPNMAGNVKLCFEGPTTGHTK